MSKLDKQLRKAGRTAIKMAKQLRKIARHVSNANA